MAVTAAAVNDLWMFIVLLTSSVVWAILAVIGLYKENKND